MVLPSFIARHKIVWSIAVIVLLLAGTGIAMLAAPAKPQYVTAPVVKGDLQQTVEAVGTVTSEHDLELKFPSVSGIVQSVAVTEGDTVVAGQVLANLRSGNVGAGVAVQAANLQSAQADLQKMEAGSRPEDIAIAEAQVANKRASLQVAISSLESAKQNLTEAQDQLRTLQQESDITLGGQVDTARSTVSTQLITADTALSTIDDMLSKTVVQDALVKDHPGADAQVRTVRDAAQAVVNTLRSQATTVQKYQEALQLMQKTQSALLQTGDVLSQLFSLIDGLPETAYFTSALREEYKGTISAQRSLVQAAAGTVTTAYGNLQSASATYDTRIATAQSAITTNEGVKQKAEADILTYQTALQTEEANLALKRAGSRPEDIDSARARVRQAAAGLAQAQASYSDTILRAPVAGTITHVYVKPGEAVPATTAAITLLGDSPFRLEMFVSEVDVPKLVRSQSGSIELDAFPGVNYKIRVSEIDTSPQLVDGVSKYRVKLDFVHEHDEFKIGMTGDATVITGERKDTVYVPGRAVLTKGDSKVVRVLQDEKVVETTVTVGMEGQSGDVEILSGLQGGETVVVLEK